MIGYKYKETLPDSAQRPQHLQKNTRTGILQSRGIKMVFEGLEAAYCTGLCWRNGSAVMVGGGGVGGCIVLYFGVVQARGGSIPHA